MIDIYDPEEFVDDWYCKDCEHGPIGIEKDACPVCGSTWLSQNDGAVDSDDMESLDELRVNNIKLLSLVKLFASFIL